MQIRSPDSLLASLAYSGDIRPGLMLVTGPRGMGKTQWCMRLSDHATSLGIHVGGLVSPAVFEKGRKTGIDLVDLDSGERRHLAFSRGSDQGDLLTNDWQMNAETLEWGNSVLERCSDFDLVILDELGPLEFNHGIGLVAAFEIIEAHRTLPVFATVRPSLIPEARLRWYWAQVLEISTEVAS